MTFTERRSSRMLPLWEDMAVYLLTQSRPPGGAVAGSGAGAVCPEGPLCLCSTAPGPSPAGQLQLSKSFNLELPEPLVDPKYFLCVSK